MGEPTSNPVEPSAPGNTPTSESFPQRTSWKKLFEDPVTRHLVWIWKGIRRRCLHPSCPRYRWYGAKAITISPEFGTVTKFIDWALAAKYQVGLTIDRKDPRGPYGPDNCRWVSKSENAGSQADVRKVVAFGESKSIWQWHLDPRCPVSASTIRSRLGSGMHPEMAISSPRHRTRAAQEPEEAKEMAVAN